MLILTRKPEQKINIISATGEHIGSITIVNVKGDRVVVGLDGPATTKFLRAECERHAPKVVADSPARQHVSGP